jgi:hypothetical protein
MKLYQEIDLPPIPEELLDFTEDKAIKIVDDIGYGHLHVKNGRILSACSYTMKFLNHQPLKDWLVNNITGIRDQQMQLQISENRNNLEGTHIVHSDVRRICALNYIIDTGGEAVTSWYQEKGKPLRRNPKQGGRQSDSGFVDYADLTTVESVKFEKNRWYLIATDVLHDVDFITGTRQGITIPYNMFVADYFWDKIFEVEK